jgi:hypothetical protein
MLWLNCDAVTVSFTSSVLPCFNNQYTELSLFYFYCPNFAKRHEIITNIFAFLESREKGH